MKIVADTNILLRDALQDDPRQARLAGEVLRTADLIAIPVPVLCEFVWVLRQGYGKSPAEVAAAIRTLSESENVVTNPQSVQAGLEILDAGGDFADGVIAHEGAWLGAEEFVSFDRQAVKLLKSQGKRARLLG
jgi:predicted nucleic-acid-binding protein